MAPSWSSLIRAPDGSCPYLPRASSELWRPEKTHSRSGAPAAGGAVWAATFNQATVLTMSSIVLKTGRRIEVTVSETDMSTDCVSPPHGQAANKHTQCLEVGKYVRPCVGKYAPRMHHVLQEV